MAEREIRYSFRTSEYPNVALPDDAMFGEPFVNVYEGKMFFKGVAGGSYIPVQGNPNFFEIGFSNVSGGSTTYVQNGLNTYTGGTSQYPTVNVSAATLDNISVSGDTIVAVLSAATIFSAGTNLYSIFQPLGAGGSGSTTYVQNGLNTYTGGTDNYPTVNISAATLNNLSVSGATSLGIVSATTIDANFILSGGTNLYDIFFNTSGGTIQGGGYPIQPGLNIYTGGTYSSQTVNMSAATLNYLSATSISSSTVNSNLVLSAGTDLYDIFELKGSIPSPNSYFPSGW